jgi:tetratricopeptide (TPR) repeat protein
LEKVKQRYGPPGWIPLVSTIIWLAHPVQAQTVNYIVQRMTILAALFYILSFFCYIKGRTTEKSALRWIYLGGSLVAGLLGLGSKETTAMLPIFLILFELYFMQDFKKPQSLKIITGVTVLLLLFCLLVFFYLGTNPLTYITKSFHGRSFTLEERLLTQSRVVLFYLSLIFLPLPSRLNLEHDFPISVSLLDPLSTLFACSVIILFIILAIAKARKAPLLSFCILWYFGNLLIESSVIGLEIIFEHRVYLPSMLVIMLAVHWLQKILRNNWQRAAAFLLLLSCLVFWTYERNLVWGNAVSLLTDTASKSPRKARPQLNLGIELKNNDRVDEAISYYHRALALDPYYAEAYYNLGNALLIKGDFKDASENYYKALRLTPQDVDTHYNLGYTLAQLWQFDKAIYHYSEAIRLKPDFMQAHKELADLRKHIKKLYKNKTPSQ